MGGLRKAPVSVGRTLVLKKGCFLMEKKGSEFKKKVPMGGRPKHVWGGPMNKKRPSSPNAAPENCPLERCPKGFQSLNGGRSANRKKRSPAYPGENLYPKKSDLPGDSTPAW